MVAPEPAAGGAGVTAAQAGGIAEDRFVLGHAIRQRLVLTCMRLSDADRYRAVCDAELALGDLDDSDPVALRMVEPIGEIGRIYDDAQLEAVLPAAYVAYRGERVEAPASADAKVQAAYQSWSVVLVVPMVTATAGVTAGEAGRLAARIERALRGWMPRLWVQGGRCGIPGVGRLTRITGDPPLHEWERQIMAVDLRYEARLQGA